MGIRRADFKEQKYIDTVQDLVDEAEISESPKISLKISVFQRLKKLKPNAEVKVREIPLNNSRMQYYWAIFFHHVLFAASLALCALFALKWSGFIISILYIFFRQILFWIMHIWTKIQPKKVGNQKIFLLSVPSKKNIEFGAKIGKLIFLMPYSADTREFKSLSKQKYYNFGATLKFLAISSTILYILLGWTTAESFSLVLQVVAGSSSIFLFLIAIYIHFSNGVKKEAIAVSLASQIASLDMIISKFTLDNPSLTWLDLDFLFYRDCGLNPRSCLDMLQKIDSNIAHWQEVHVLSLKPVVWPFRALQLTSKTQTPSNRSSLKDDGDLIKHFFLRQGLPLPRIKYKQVRRVGLKKVQFLEFNNQHRGFFWIFPQETLPAQVHQHIQICDAIAEWVNSLDETISLNFSHEFE